MGLAGARRETEVDVFTSTTARNKDIAGNPIGPKGCGETALSSLSSPPRNEGHLLVVDS